ncbi:MAG: thiolase family protein [Methylocystaceae bacterium]
MTKVYVIGSYSTQFKRWEDKTHKDLTRMAYLGVRDDAGIPAEDLEFIWFSNSGWGNSVPPSEDDPGIPGQMNVRGQVAMAPLVNEGLVPKRIPCINVEGACAGGSLAFHGAYKDIMSGLVQVSLALGVEKTWYPKHPAMVIQAFTGGVDVSELASLIKQYQEIGQECGKIWSGGVSHTLFMDTYATQAAWHMWKWGTTRNQLAIAASKNHFHGSLNPLAQYQFPVPVEKVLSDYEVSWPLTRAMCAPLGDGAAAAILCSEDYLKNLPLSIRSRAVQVLASVISGGHERSIVEPSLSHWAAQRAYQSARIEPSDIDLAEVHDATAFCEIYQAEMLGFCPVGQGGELIESGATRYDGKTPINTSGGLESKGHPVAATGLSQINEIIIQLRGEAGQRQVKDAEIGLVENGGGVVSVEEFCCGVTILRKTAG